MRKYEIVMIVEPCQIGMDGLEVDEKVIKKELEEILEEAIPGGRLACDFIIDRILVRRLRVKPESMLTLKKGKIIEHAVASIEWTRKEMRKRGLDPKKGEDRALFKEMCE